MGFGHQWWLLEGEQGPGGTDAGHGLATTRRAGIMASSFRLCGDIIVLFVEITENEFWVFLFMILF